MALYIKLGNSFFIIFFSFPFSISHFFHIFTLPYLKSCLISLLVDNYHYYYYYYYCYYYYRRYHYNLAKTLWTLNNTLSIQCFMVNGFSRIEVSNFLCKFMKEIINTEKILNCLKLLFIAFLIYFCISIV